MDFKLESVDYVVSDVYIYYRIYLLLIDVLLQTSLVLDARDHLALILNKWTVQTEYYSDLA
jgi:hypothetical protein